MNECNSTEVTNVHCSLSDQTQFRPNEIKEIKDYFNAEIQERSLVNILLLLISLTNL